MKGDFSRDTFDPDKHFLRVLQQQGRVQLDSDWNEQVSILLHQLQLLARDSIGRHGTTNGGFQILDKTEAGDPLTKDFRIKPGRYYVEGMLCENPSDRLLSELPDYARPDGAPASGPNYLVYLDVWERHVTYIEDDGIREKALNGADTSSRSELVWQARLESLNNMSAADAVENFKDGPNAYENFRKRVARESTGKLQADVEQNGHAHHEPCLAAPDARYRGLENQLYRVEIHRSGVANTARWKWSRDNGSIVFPMAEPIKTDGNETTITLEHLGRDRQRGLGVNDYVEVVDDDYVRKFVSGKLLRVKELREDQRQVILEGTPDVDVGKSLDKHPLLRRWDHGASPPLELADDGAIPVQENTIFELKDGIQIQFGSQPLNGAGPNDPTWYGVGAYWLIPARVASANIEWKSRTDNTGQTVREWLSPKGIRHYYAPLAHINVAGTGVVAATDLRHDTSLPIERTLSITPVLKAWNQNEHGISECAATSGSQIQLIPVTLPDKARLVRLLASGRKGTSTSIKITLKTCSVTSFDGSTVLAEIDPATDLATLTEFKVSKNIVGDPVVDNTNFRYFITVSGSTGDQLWSVQVVYKPN